MSSQLGIGTVSSQPKRLQQTRVAAVAQVQLWDCNKVRQISCLSGHSARVSSMAWNGSVLSTGSRDTSILNHDVRCVGPHPILRLSVHNIPLMSGVWCGAHCNEVCLVEGSSSHFAVGSRPTCKAA